MGKAPAALRSAIFDMESPLTSAEAAATTLNMIASDLGSDDEATAIVYLAIMIRTHLKDLRERFDRASSLALKGDQPAA